MGWHLGKRKKEEHFLVPWHVLQGPLICPGPIPRVLPSGPPLRSGQAALGALQARQGRKIEIFQHGILQWLGG